MMAQRPGQAPVIPDLSALNLNLPPVAPSIPGPGGRDREAGLVKLVRELEEEVRVLKSENEKQVHNDIIAKSGRTIVDWRPFPSIHRKR
jgi:hypothetical protein